MCKPCVVGTGLNSSSSSSTNSSSSNFFGFVFHLVFVGFQARIFLKLDLCQHKESQRARKLKNVEKIWKAFGTAFSGAAKRHLQLQLLTDSAVARDWVSHSSSARATKLSVRRPRRLYELNQGWIKLNQFWIIEVNEILLMISVSSQAWGPLCRKYFTSCHISLWKELPFWYYSFPGQLHGSFMSAQERQLNISCSNSFTLTLKAALVQIVLPCWARNSTFVSLNCLRR